jgi:UDP-N-acetylmuramoylalanine--D-glutamate ligase
MVQSYSNEFKNKKITIMGLGLLGRGIGVTKFLAQCGAQLLVTDLKTEAELAPALKALSKFKNITYILGRHRLADFRDCDMIIRAANVPIDSPYLEQARRFKIPIEMDASLFARLAPKVTLIGITGTRGKSTVTQLIFEILQTAYAKTKKRVYLGGNVRGLATLPLLKKVRPGDIVVLELDSWQCSGFGEAKISPQISVFTNFMVDHLNYYKGDMNQYFADKANIYKYQHKGDILVTSREMVNFIKDKESKKIISKLIIASSAAVKKWKLKIAGEHNRYNVALAMSVAVACGIPVKTIRRVAEQFTGLPGRLQYLRSVRGVGFYNDTNATTPDAVIAAVLALEKYKGKIVLIGGGNDKQLDYAQYAEVIPRYAKELILFTGAGTDKIQKAIGDHWLKMSVVGSMTEAMQLARTVAKKGDIVVLSPGATSFGVFLNEYDRGDQFVKLVKKLK